VGDDIPFLPQEKISAALPSPATPSNGSLVRPLSTSQLYVVNPDRPSSSHKPESIAPYTRHVSAVVDSYFGTSISADILPEEDQSLPGVSPLPPSPPPKDPRHTHAQGNPPVHPAYRRHTVALPNATYPRPLKRLPSFGPTDMFESVGARVSIGHSPNDSPTQTLPHPSTHATRHPNRWYVVLYNYIRVQPSNYPPKQIGTESLCNLEHDVAPYHWLLRWLQGLVWLAILIVFCLRLSKVTTRNGGRLPFECYQLVTGLGMKRPNILSRHSDDTQTIGVVNSRILMKLFNSKTVCSLAPLNGAVLLADDFVTLVLLGVTACGLASWCRHFGSRFGRGR
jgi:hypothetical protein